MIIAIGNTVTTSPSNRFRNHMIICFYIVNVYMNGSSIHVTNIPSIMVNNATTASVSPFE